MALSVQNPCLEEKPPDKKMGARYTNLATIHAARHSEISTSAVKVSPAAVIPRSHF